MPELVYSSTNPVLVCMCCDVYTLVVVQDKKSVESCCQCFSRLVESFSSNHSILRQVVTTFLLQNLQQLVSPPTPPFLFIPLPLLSLSYTALLPHPKLVVSPPVISSSTFVTVLRMLSTLCSTCPPLAVELLKISTRHLLTYCIQSLYIYNSMPYDNL